MTTPTLYAATVEEAGHTFEAIDVLPVLAMARLEAGIRNFKRCGPNSDLTALTGKARTRTLRAGEFRRT